jgi:transcription initiation factor IIF auxiliary subunit
MALKIAQNDKYVGDDYWKWEAWLEGPSKELDQVKSVTYTLHPTFPNPVRTIESRDNKFKLKTAGWGTFTLYAKVLRKNGSTEKLKHDVELRYPSGETTTA